MTDNLDILLAKLANAPMPQTLAGLSDAVMGRIHVEAASARTSRTVGIAAMVGALMLGATGALAFPATAPAAPLAAFGMSAALAPSTLLDGGR